MENHTYDSTFFDFVNISSGGSAQAFVAGLQLGFTPASVLDVGCGRGVWLKAWKKQGVKEVRGLDGLYVAVESLLISPDEFQATDLTNSFDVGRRYDLVQCLEVGEHIPEQHADVLVASLVAHGDVILFSSATPGQGGEHHVNEKPLSFWADKFRLSGYDAFDYPRMALRGTKEIEPWYRYNTVLYANHRGQSRLAPDVIRTMIPCDQDFPDYESTIWRLRRMLLRAMPAAVVNMLSRMKHHVVVFVSRHKLAINR
ncbi:MAG: methyltransferase domain-containing protein [bacterium]